MYCRQTTPGKFKLEFYGNNLNKKSDERATLDNIGSILYECMEDSEAAAMATTNGRDKAHAHEADAATSHLIVKPLSVSLLIQFSC